MKHYYPYLLEKIDLVARQVKTEEDTFHSTLANGESLLNEELKKHAEEYSAETLEEKCYALRGRAVSQAKFSYEPKTPRLVVDKTNGDENEPYGGIVVQYSGKNR